MLAFFQARYQFFIIKNVRFFVPSAVLKYKFWMPMIKIPPVIVLWCSEPLRTRFWPPIY